MIIYLYYFSRYTHLLHTANIVVFGSDHTYAVPRTYQYIKFCLESQQLPNMAIVRFGNRRGNPYSMSVSQSVRALHH